MAFFTNVRTGARARAMILTMVYNKVSKLRNVGDKSIGEVRNLTVSEFWYRMEYFIYYLLHAGVVVMSQYSSFS